MKIIKGLLDILLWILDKVLPAFGVSDSFFVAINSSFVIFIGFLRAAAYILPLDVLVSCIVVILIVDNFAFFMRLGQFILKLIRG